jgi:D-alanyl-lipoteichoic acid acyltransferase DltB (MBOAT superfamily)
MLFNSAAYLAMFLPLVVLVAMLLRRAAGPKTAQAAVLIASLVFYSWFKPANLPYLLGSLLVNWWLSGAMDRQQREDAQPRRKRLLQLGLALNICFLCTFKYVNFFLSSISFLLPRGFHFPELEFPLGISFFTLAQIMYLVDTYEGLLPAMGLFDYATFVSFFPYVISGPIPKSKRIQHQFADFGGKPGQELELFTRGLYLFVMGLSKKVLLADGFAKLANVGFAPGASLSALEAWAFAIAYCMQMYFDFSGYSDMAIGSALMLGIEIPRNFDAPLRALSISEFWQRWHISLSQFITTYLYTPLLKSMRRRKLFQSVLVTSAIAIFFAMCIAGLWHGPAWTFVVYGVIHGAALACNQFWHKKNMPHIPEFVSWALTFFVVLLALIFFRAESLHTGFAFTAALFNPHRAFALATFLPTLKTLTIFSQAMLPLGLVLAFFGPSSDRLSRDFKPTLATALTTGALFVASCIFMAFNTSQSFLYFQF